MSRIPLALAADGADDEPEELPCGCCGEPTTWKLSLSVDDALPCCGRVTCREWVAEMLHKMD